MTPDEPGTPSSAPISGTRRTLAATAVVGLAGLAGGLWLAQANADKGRSAKAGPGEPLPEDTWARQFDTLSGTPLLLSNYRGKGLLINFWATWCPPCVKEMPELSRFHQQFKPQGWHVLGLAIDGPTPVREFLRKAPVSFDIGLAGFDGTELARALGNQSGGLPFSVLIDPQGRIRQRKMGVTTLAEISGWVKAI